MVLHGCSGENQRPVLANGAQHKAFILRQNHTYRMSRGSATGGTPWSSDQTSTGNLNTKRHETKDGTTLNVIRLY